jgi:hypothetical protein
MVKLMTGSPKINNALVTHFNEQFFIIRKYNKGAHKS